MPSRRAAGERPRINAQAAAPRPFLRTLATSDALTAPAWLPQLDRTKLTTAATSLSVMRQSKPGIAYCVGAAVVPASAPLSTIWISEAGSAELTVELSANCGKVRRSRRCCDGRQAAKAIGHRPWSCSCAARAAALS